MPDHEVAALVFDVFGTVVDWRSGIIEATRSLTLPSGADLGAFADDWRKEGYLAPIAEIVSGARPYAPVEDLLAAPLDDLLKRHGLGLREPDQRPLLAAWSRLDPWPDVAEGLGRLRRRFLTAPLSNASVAQLTWMARRAGLSWDCILSTELFGTYKPSPTAYLGAARLLGLEPGQLMLVAAHPLDLRAAAAAGLATAYVDRPEEWGPGAQKAPPPDPGTDVVASDFVALAEKLGA